MLATRRTQPYRRAGARHSGLALQAMKRGKPAYGMHPMDMQRRAAKRFRARRRKGGLATLAIRRDY